MSFKKSTFRNKNNFRKNNQEPYDDENAAPLRRSSRGSSTSANYQNPNSLGRNGVGERSRVNIPLDLY
jgi:hypothetical protein